MSIKLLMFPRPVARASYISRIAFCALLGCALSFTTQIAVEAQIPQGSLQVKIEDFANIGDGARMSMMTQHPLGHLLFVNDQQGRIYSISQDGSSVTTFLDITSSAFSGINLTGAGIDGGSGEQGFQSFAFHPDFANAGTAGAGKFYTIHSSSDNDPGDADFSLVNPNTSQNPSGNNSFHSVLLEWSTNDPTASTYSAGGNAMPREILRFGQPYGNHNGGQLAFNPTVGSGNADYGNLYIGLGDGGSANDPLNAAQNTSNPFGALLRIDPIPSATPGENGANGQYKIVTENQFASDADSNTLGEIFAFGLRNPQRFGWDSNESNSFPYIADIGQGQIEEINLAENGGNFGWDIHEGSADVPPFIDPVFEYDQTSALVFNSPGGLTGGRAITMGEVVRNSGILGLDGKLLLGDFPTGFIFYGDVDNDPLDGGQDGLRELVMLDELGNEVRLIDLIRAEQNNNSINRADLRFSFNVPGKVFVLNKRDGVIRQLVAIPEPSSAWTLGACLLWLARRQRRIPRT